MRLETYWESLQSVFNITHIAMAERVCITPLQSLWDRTPVGRAHALRCLQMKEKRGDSRWNQQLEYLQEIRQL